MKRGREFIIVFLLSGLLWADSRQHYFEQGNQYYRDGEFVKALEAYQKITDTGYENGPLYFNIGNCYYKTGEIGRAILNYERARKYIPSDEDLKANLAIAQLSVVDQIEPASDFFVIQILHAFYYILPEKLQLSLVLMGYILFTGSLVFLILSRSLRWRTAAVRLLWMSGVVFVLLLFSYAGRMLDARNSVEAVILKDKVDVMSAPTAQGGMEVFSLHEGTKVRLDRFSGEWVEIVLPDRKVGWVKNDVLEKI